MSISYKTYHDETFDNVKIRNSLTFESETVPPAFTLGSQGVGVFNGSSGQPSFYFSGDANTDTGFYRPGENIIGATTGGVERLRITNQGLLLHNGSAASPALSFTSDAGTNLGLYRQSEDNLGISANGNEVVKINPSGIHVISGTAVSPTYSFINDFNTGFSNSGADQISIITNGSERIRVTNSALLNQDGTAASPSFSFLSDTDTGYYRNGNNEFSVSTGGVERTRVTSTGLSVQSGTYQQSLETVLDADLSGNTKVGKGAGIDLTTGLNNTLVGLASGANVTTGNFNTLLGGVSGFDLTIGSENTLAGYSAGENIISGDGNTIYGYDAGDSITTGRYNVVVGRLADTDPFTEDAVSIGHNTIARGNASVAIGARSNTTDPATGSISIGGGAVGFETTASAAGSIAIGTGTFISTQATGNSAIAIGADARAIDADAIAIGNNTFVSVADSVAIGHSSLAAAINSVAIGSGSGTGITDAVQLGNTNVIHAFLGSFPISLRAYVQTAVWNISPVPLATNFALTGGSSVGSLTFPANFFRQGRSLRLTCAGEYTVTVPDTTMEILVEVKLGGVDLFSSPTDINTPSAVGTYSFEYDGFFTCELPGAVAGFLTKDKLMSESNGSAVTGNHIFFEMSTGHPLGIDTTGPLTLAPVFRVTAALGGTISLVSVTVFNVEVVG